VAPSVPSRDGRREGIPVAIMEGSACGIPVVASRLSGIPELVEDGKQGLLVPPGDAGALAAALEALHADPALRLALGREGRAKVVSEFDQGSNAAALALRFRTGAAR
jgi:glycosyltransferase involved in cell wall biosynthesis